MGYNYNTGANRRARKASAKGPKSKIGKAANAGLLKHPAAGVGAYAAGMGAVVGLGGRSTIGLGAAGAAMGGAAGRYGRIGRINAMKKGMHDPQLSLRHGLVEHPNQRNAATGVRSSTTSEVKFQNRVGKKG